MPLYNLTPGIHTGSRNQVRTTGSLVSRGAAHPPAGARARAPGVSMLGPTASLFKGRGAASAPAAPPPKKKQQSFGLDYDDEEEPPAAKKKGREKGDGAKKKPKAKAPAAEPKRAAFATPAVSAAKAAPAGRPKPAAGPSSTSGGYKPKDPMSVAFGDSDISMSDMEVRRIASTWLHTNHMPTIASACEPHDPASSHAAVRTGRAGSGGGRARAGIRRAMRRMRRRDQHAYVLPSCVPVCRVTSRSMQARTSP